MHHEHWVEELGPYPAIYSGCSRTRACEKNCNTFFEIWGSAYKDLHKLEFASGASEKIWWLYFVWGHRIFVGGTAPEYPRGDAAACIHQVVLSVLSAVAIQQSAVIILREREKNLHAPLSKYLGYDDVNISNEFTENFSINQSINRLTSVYPH